MKSMASLDGQEDQNRRFFVAVHVGAGYHSPSNEKALRSAMKRACLAAASVLRKVLVFSWLHVCVLELKKKKKNLPSLWY